MPYVMVPVPEDLVEDVMQFVLRAMSRSAQEPWDRESLDGLWGEIDELARALLAFVARSVLDGRDLSEVEAARMVQLTGREVLAIHRELNERAREAQHPPLIQQRTLDVVQPNGRVAEQRVLTMEADVADIVRQVEQADLRSDPASGTVPGEADR